MICGVMFSDQFTRVPLLAWELLRICSVQWPLAFTPIRDGQLADGPERSRYRALRRW